MMLSGQKIKEEILNQNIFIEDFDESRLNPNSYNLRLGSEFMVYTDKVLDMKKKPNFRTFEITDEGFQMEPGVLYLAKTKELTYTPKHIPMLSGRSSIGRYGITVHVTAGFGDIGFNGRWTLEMTCVEPIIIYPNVQICQIYYHDILGDYIPYHSDKYQNSEDVRPSLLYKEFE